MIGKISARGTRVAGLLYYLYGPGRNEAHTDPHLVAGWRDPAELEPALRHDGRRNFRHLSGLLQQPHAALGPRGFGRPVWHCSVRAAPQDRILSDQEWAQIARDVMDRTGLAPRGQDDDAVRWIALRHAPDHIHIVAMLARQDGARPRFWNDYYRLGEACWAAEERFGLRRTAPRDRTAGSRPTRAESEKARRQGRSEPPRITLRRAVSTAAAASSSEQEFFARLETAGVSARKRFSSRNPGEVTGYAVALPSDRAGDGGPVWYSGGKLAPDLTLPKLRHRWAGTQTVPSEPFTAAERSAIWEHVTRTAGAAAERIRNLAANDPASAADATWAAADTLHAAAAALGSRMVRQAADSYARAARVPYGGVPCRTPAGDGLRQAARLMSATAHLSGDPGATEIRLILRLAALAEAITDLRLAQRHAAQATAALRAAQCLYKARTPAAVKTAVTARTAANLSRVDFPMPARTFLREAAAAGAAPRDSQATVRRPRHSPANRPRGPTR